jgi:signal transduction histidine kinase
MLKLNPFAISGILIAITYLPLFIFIFKNGTDSLPRIYSLHILSIAVWGCSAFLTGSSNNFYIATLSLKIGHAVSLFIPVFFLHAMRVMVNNPFRKLILFAYVQAIIFILLIITNQMYTGFPKFRNSFFYANGSIYYLVSFLIWEFLIIKSHIEIFSFYKKDVPKQIFFQIFGGIGFIGGTMNFLPGLGLNIYPYGNFLIPIHSLTITYAIFKHRLFNLDFVYKKGLVYSILFTTTTLIYLVIVVISEKFIQYNLGYTSPSISISTAFLIGTIFIPLRNKIQCYVDQTFFQSSPISIIDENERLRQEITQTEKLKSIATFASGMAHEIKNPLTSIKIFCEYLPKKLNDQEFLNKFIPIVTRDADRINELVHHLLEYAKPSPPEVRPTDIHKLIETVLDALSAQIVNKKIEIVRDFDNKSIENIAIDAKQIKQALLNIFLNAVESIDTTGSLLITTRLSPDERKALLKITDNGCGISKEDLSHIFDPFFTKKEKGTGLGLSITHGIIKEHGGKIFVESALGRGTTFRIELPIKK